MFSFTKRDAFTLIELMMVIVIIGIIAAAGTPYMVKSIRGNRRKAAARAVIAAGRYARSMAVMRQKQVALIFHIAAGKIEVRDGAAVASAISATTDPEEPEEEAVEPDVNADFLSVEAAGEPVPTKGIGAVGVMLSRKLDGVRIESVDIDRTDTYTEESCAVLYRRNGLCTPYCVKLIDEYGKELIIDVDAFSSAKTEERRW